MIDKKKNNITTRELNLSLARLDLEIARDEYKQSKKELSEEMINLALAMGVTAEEAAQAFYTNLQGQPTHWNLRKKLKDGSIIIDDQGPQPLSTLSTKH